MTNSPHIFSFLVFLHMEYHCNQSRGSQYKNKTNLDPFLKVDSFLKVYRPGDDNTFLPSRSFYSGCHVSLLLVLKGAHLTQDSLATATIGFGEWTCMQIIGVC